MELRQLRTFQTVARLLSFNRAAEVLNYAQSTVSVQIRLLEEEFGVPLFNRLGKRIRLTEAGRMLLRYSQKMLAIESETLDQVSGCKEPHGFLSIRIPQSIGTCLLPAVLSRFQARFPKVGFDIGTCAYDELIYELKSGITDVAFLLAESIPFSELKSELLRVERLVLVAGSTHALGERSSIRLNDLASTTILLPKHDCSYRMRFEEMLTEEKVEGVTFMEVNSLEAIKQCVLRGIGVALMPLMAIVKEIEERLLTVLPWPEDPLETGILMILHKDKWLSPTLRAFMDTVRAVMQSPNE